MNITFISKIKSLLEGIVIYNNKGRLVVLDNLYGLRINPRDNLRGVVKKQQVDQAFDFGELYDMGYQVTEIDDDEVTFYGN